MRQYETMYVLRSALEPERTAEQVTRYQSIVTDGGAQLDQVQELGKRRLAYEIDHEKDGYYVLMQYSADTNVSQELERVMRIDDTVLRFLTVRLGE